MGGEPQEVTERLRCLDGRLVQQELTSETYSVADGWLYVWGQDGCNDFVVEVTVEDTWGLFNL